MEEANKLIGEGKKHLVLGKAVEAVSALQEACGMLAKKYGDTADECGEAFFWCGRALLELARMENSVLGNALEGVPEEEEEDEEEEEKHKDSNVESTKNIDEKTRDELRVQVYDAMAEKTSEDAEKKSEDADKTEAGDEEKKSVVDGSKSEDEKENDKEAEKENDKEAEKEEESADKPEEAEDGEEKQQQEEEEDDADEEMEGVTEEQGEGDGAAEKDSDEEEVGNLQLAWEMLEVAKVIYKRKVTKEDQLMAAQAHLKLGEVSAESGNYSQALEDFQECLKLQKQHLDPDSRLLAESHYQLGLTHSLNLEYSKAIEELNSSISVIKSRLDKLQELLDKAEDPEALPNERTEMEELKALLPEIQEKVEDATEGLKTASTTAEAVKGVLDSGSTSSAFPGSSVQKGDSSSSPKIDGTSANGVSSTSGHVSDISHLVRKKRKQEDSPVKEGVVKKVKKDDGHTDEVQEPHTNGVPKAAGDPVGHANSMEVESH
uniref:nuclear autoantigenic sperm protein-like n=1 Tax=Monopterus albus TaxID=43700 RepID=UPI0009B37047|nr:nuclear autoantigenic sperm protein-like [Monopterus albus]